MTNGFYDLSGMKEDELRAFYKDAVFYGYDIHLEHCPSWSREKFIGCSVGEFIDGECLTKTHNVCIDRSIYSSGLNGQDYGEVGFCRLSEIEGKPSFLYIFMTIDNLNKLVSKHGLKLTHF